MEKWNYISCDIHCHARSRKRTLLLDQLKRKREQRRKRKAETNSTLLYSLVVSRSIGKVAPTGDCSGWSDMELYRLVSSPRVSMSLIELVTSLNFHSVKYAGLEIAGLTSASPESIATTRDIDGLSVGDDWLHNRPTLITRFASSSLSEANCESSSSISSLFSCRCQA